MKPKHVVLLRVGIDSGSGGMAGPVFNKESGPFLNSKHFEFVPIKADRTHKLGHTYGTVQGIKTKKPLVDYFPPSRQSVMKNHPIHDDPEFTTFTYGDPTMPKQGLRELEPGDLLVLYAGLRGWNDCDIPEALYIIGYFIVKIAGTYQKLVNSHNKAWIENEFQKNWHIIHGDIKGCSYERHNKQTGKVTLVKSQLVLVKGAAGSRLLNKAYRLSAASKRADKGGHLVYVLDPALKKHFGNFTTLNAIQRSIPRWVESDYIESAAKFIKQLA